VELALTGSDKCLRVASKRLFVCFLWLFCFCWLFPAPISHAVSYSPPAEQAGSQAISMDAQAFLYWATGYEHYEAGTYVDSVWQTPALALGAAAGTSYDIVSLGRGGQITMTFDPPISNGAGWDFAVFENAFNDYLLELAYVEVSSNGSDFARFDSISLTPDPVSGYGSLDATLIDGLAGKYRQGYGTPFDLEDLSAHLEIQSGIVDISRITSVRIVDIVGDGSCFDSQGHVIYDPFPTVGSAGFDLDAIGVSNGAPYPEGSEDEIPAPTTPEKEGKAGFGGQSGCFIESLIRSPF